MENLNASGIYSISSSTTSMVYVGSTINFENRFRLHHYQFQRGKNKNKALQYQYNLSSNDLVYTIMEVVQTTGTTKQEIRKELQTRETQVIKTFEHEQLCNVHGNVLPKKKIKKTVAEKKVKRDGDHYCSKRIIDTITGAEYDTITIAAYEHNLSRPALSRMLSGHTKNKTNLTYKQ